MATFNICTALPQTVIDNLRSNGAEIREACKIIVINVLDQKTIRIYDNSRISYKEVDLLLTPHFGNPMAPYVNNNVQTEVYQLLQAFKVDGFARKQQTKIVPAGGVYQYHSQIAINCVIRQIENPDVGFGFVDLPHVPLYVT